MKIIIVATSLLLLLPTLESSDGHLESSKSAGQNCKKYAFVVTIVRSIGLKPVDVAASVICTGSLITMNVVVTTLSCTYRFLRTIGFLRSYPNITIIAGYDPKMKTFDNRTMARIIPFNATALNKGGSRSSESDDLVLLQLNEPFKPSPKLELIKLAEQGRADKCKQAQTVTRVPEVQKGGARGLVGNLLQNKVDALTLKVVCKSVSLVKKIFCAWSWVRSKFSLCGETKGGWSKREVGGEASCEDAVGSPLVCEGALIGVQSQCKRGGARSDPVQTSFLKLDPYLDFIATNVKELREEVRNIRNGEKKKKKVSGTDKPKSGSRGWKMAAGLCFVCLFLIGFA